VITRLQVLCRRLFTARAVNLFINEVFIMEKLDFNNSLYYLLMDHAGVADETDGQRLAGCSVDQMFDDMFEREFTARAVKGELQDD